MTASSPLGKLFGMATTSNLNDSSKTSLFSQILLAAFLGIATGIFFGEDCSFLRPIGTIYISLLLVVLYPFMICTLISGLGTLSHKTTIQLFKNSWHFYLLLLIICFGIIWILATAIPVATELGSLLKNQAPPNLIEVLFSTNIFASLSQNQLPAVIIFCLILALMLQRLREKAETLFKILDVISNACTEFWGLLVKISPYAIFCILAYATGTIKLSELTGAGVFLFLFFVGTLTLGFWLIPILITNMTPISYKDLMLNLREAIVIVGVTSTSALSLPYINNIASKLFNPQKNENTNHVIGTSLILGFTFASFGRLFIYMFIIFAALFFNHPLSTYERSLLPIVTFISQITGINAAVLFLSQWLHLPKRNSSVMD